MSLFILGLIIFLGTHFFTAVLRAQRDALRAKMGEQSYKGVYSIVALAGFVLIILGWPDANASVLYTTPFALRYVSYVLMAIALILLVSAYAPAGRIAAAVKHPMLAGVKIWAFAHLLVNGEVRSVLLFGSFLAFAVVDRIAVKRRNAPVRTAGPLRNDVIAIVVGAIAYGAITHFLHRYIAGVALY
ncbi:MAG: NnrU family protein [Hyphococcus sp.]